MKTLQLIVLSLILIGISAPAVADQPKEEREISFGGRIADEEDASGDSIQDRLDAVFDALTFYDNPKNPYVQKLRFTGRFQVDTYSVDLDEGGSDSDWVIRRWRMGFSGTIFKDFKFKTKADFVDDEAGGYYNKLTDFYISYAPEDADYRITLGKHSAAFTLDGHTSSKVLHTTERSIIGSNIWFSKEYFPGISATVRMENNWAYRVGIFSSGRENPEFGEFDGSYFGLATLAYFFEDHFNLDDGVIGFDLVYQDEDEDNTFTRKNESIYALSFRVEDDRWGLHGNISASQGYQGQSDLWGALIMPFYKVTEKFELVTRYTHMESSDTQGISPNRYAREVSRARGDEYTELYLGANYYIDGHRIKIQLGAEFSDMEDHSNSGGDYENTGFTGAFRMYW
jgi:phosphate-selective porin OprO/OprP